MSIRTFQAQLHVFIRPAISPKPINIQCAIIDDEEKTTYFHILETKTTAFLAIIDKGHWNQANECVLKTEVVC